MLDRQHIGRSLRRVTRVVEAGRLRFFLDVIGDKERAFATHAAERPLRVPPTYLLCLEMMDDPDPLYWLTDIGVNLLHILHGQQRFGYHAPAFAGDTLSFAASIDDIYEKKGGRCSSSSNGQRYATRPTQVPPRCRRPSSTAIRRHN